MRKVFIYIFLALCLQAYGQKNDLKLNEAINIALKNNPDISKYQHKIDEARAKYTSGISLPQLNLSLSYEYTPDGKGLGDYGERTIEINQQMEFPTKYFTRSSRLNKDIEIAESDFELSKIRLTGKIKSAYYKVIYKKLGLNIARENILLSEDFLSKSQIRYDVGEGTNLELLTAKVQKTEAKNQLENAEYELTSAITELQYEMGLSENKDFKYDFDDSLVYIKLNLDGGSLVDLAKRENPRVNIADKYINISELEKSLAWQSLLPNINFSYYRQAVLGNTNFYGISFGISVPIWFMFENKGKIQEANVSINIAETERKSISNNITADVNNSFQEYLNKERELLLYQSDILKQAEEVYHTAKISYEEGEANYLFLLEAKKTLINAKENYLNALYQYKIAFVKLEQAVGKILEN